MSFWPFCCKKPQAYAIEADEGYLNFLYGQFCPHYLPESPAGRPSSAESLHVAGARSGRVVSNPIKFKSVCGLAGVSEEGKLYVWGGDAARAAAYRNSIDRYTADRVPPASLAENVLRLTLTPEFVHRSPAGSWTSGGTAGVQQIGDDSDWKFVASPPDADGGPAVIDAIIAVKEDGTVWTLGGWQSGVDCSWGSEYSQIKPHAWRAKLNSAISRILTEFSAPYGFGLPVWFTAAPQPEAVLQKIRLRPKGSGRFEPDVTIADGEPGSNAQVSAVFRAKIDDGCIRGVTIESGGSGYAPGSELAVTIKGHEDSGNGAIVFAKAGDSRSLESILIVNPGEGYRHPVTATVTGNALLSVVEPRRVRVTNNGQGYIAKPVVTVKPAPDEQSDEAQPGAAFLEVSDMSRCGVGEFRVVSAGQGYTTATAIERRTGATATAVVNESGQVVGWNLNSPGASVYSPLDDEPLSVEVTGDGEGCEASAVPSGSGVLELKVVSNPEVWTLPPEIEITGGGGSNAEAVAEGIIGRLLVSVEQGGEGYTKTTPRWLRRQATETRMRSLYCPCVTVGSQHAVGGRLVGGSVIVGEAILSPGEVSEIAEDPQEYCNPYDSPYAVADDRGYTQEQDTLNRHLVALTSLTVGTSGVVHPFEEELSVSGMYTPATFDDVAMSEYVSQCLKFYLRGPNHHRHALTHSYVEGTAGSGVPKVRVSLPAAVSFSSPPSLCVEVHARPHKQQWVVKDISILVDPNLDEDDQSRSCYVPEIVPGDEAPGAKEWWANAPRNMGYRPDQADAPFFVAGAVTATGETGSVRTYQVVDGVLFAESEEPANGPWPWPAGATPGGAVEGLVPYTGPLLEVTYADPAPSWSQPSAPQRVHFVYPTGEDFPALGEAEAIYDAAKKHPVVGPVEIKENGKYTEEPEPLVMFGADPIPRSAGLSACSSAGFGLTGDAFAMCEGELLWWGYNAAIASNVSFYVQPSQEVDEDDPEEVYNERLREIARSNSFLTAQPTPVGGSLRFAVSGDHAADAADAMGVGPTAYLRMPRPQHGNRVARLDHVFSQDTRGEWAISPGRYERHRELLRYRSFPLSRMDHGLGYDSIAPLEYRGPGQSPHTMTLTATVVGNGIDYVGRNGFLRDAEGKWRVPAGRRYESATAFSWSSSDWRDLRLQERTVTMQTVSRPAPCGLNLGPDDGVMNFSEVYTAVDGPLFDLKPYIVVVRTPGQGYRIQPADENFEGQRWSEIGGGIGELDVTIQPKGFGVDLDNFTPPMTTRASLVVKSLGPAQAVKQLHPTSSRGGFRYPAYLTFFLIDAPTGSTRGGSGASVEVFVSPETRFTPFSLWCLDNLSSTVEPAAVRPPFFVADDSNRYSGGLAAAPDGTLRTVRERLAFRPEAFQPESGASPLVATAITNATDYQRLPYLEEGLATHIVRDTGGQLWTVRMGARAGNSGDRRGPFLLPLAFAEPQSATLLAPLAIASTATGEGYDYPVAVATDKPTGVAAGTAEIDGKIVGFAVVDGGSGYESPPLVTGASAEAMIAGPVWRVDVTSGGSGYRQPPRVRFSQPGLPAEAVATIEGGEVKSVKVLSGGMYRQEPPLVSFEPVKDVESVSITSGGQGYSERPSVVITGGGGEGASGTASISCAVSEIVMLSEGSGYTTTPLVEITGGGGTGASARAVLDADSGRIVRIEIIFGGTAYATPPSVRILSTDTGAGASAFAKIEGFVSQIDLTSRGAGYDVPPKVIITGGGGTGAEATATLGSPGSGAAATARINGSVISVKATSPGSGLQRPPVVQCVRTSQPVAGLSRTEAVIKATILGRPTSVTVTNPGADYCPPFYSPEDSQGPSRLKTPSRPVRRPFVVAKGSFCFRHSTTLLRSSDSLPFSLTKIGSESASNVVDFRHYWLNAFPALGVARISGADADGGGGVSGVDLPRTVVRLRVTATGSGYAPHSLVPIKFKTDGTRDDRLRLFWEYRLNPTARIRPSPGDVVAYAYAGHDGKIAGIVGVQEFGFIPYISPPLFEVSPASGQPGSGATVVGELDHPLECYYAPQVLFDGDAEVEADMALTLAGVCVEGDSPLPSPCIGAGVDSPHWERVARQGAINRSRLFQVYFPKESATKRVRLLVAGKVVGFSPLERPEDWEDEDKEFYEAPAGFFSPSFPPRVFVEDEDGTGASVDEAPLPPSSAISAKWIGECSLQRGGSGYTLGSRIRLTGGRPLAWDSPATASASVGQDGRIQSVSITSGGKGYTRVPVAYVVGDGSGASVEVPEDAINPHDGSINSLRIVSKGSGYTSAAIVIVDREVVADESEAVSRLCAFIDSRYSVVLEDCVVERAVIPPESRRQQTTVAARRLLEPVELAPADSVPAALANSVSVELQAAGYALHPAYLSDGYVEYVRLEHHFGQVPPASPTITITPNSDVAPSRPATAIATIPLADNVFSSTVANVTRGGTDFPPYQFD